MAVIGVALVIGGLLWLIAGAIGGRGRGKEKKGRDEASMAARGTGARTEESGVKVPVATPLPDPVMGDDEIERAAFDLVRKESENR